MENPARFERGRVLDSELFLDRAKADESLSGAPASCRRVCRFDEVIEIGRQILGIPRVEAGVRVVGRHLDSCRVLGPALVRGEAAARGESAHRRQFDQLWWKAGN